MSNILKEELGIIEFRSTFHLYAPEITRKIQSVWQPDMILILIRWSGVSPLLFNTRNMEILCKKTKRQKDKKKSL